MRHWGLKKTSFHLFNFHVSKHHLIPVLIFLLPALWGCGPDGPRVCVRKGDGTPACFTVEVVETPDQRQMGLMYRKSLAEKKGMLFIFETERPQAFTMKNTFVPLDMIFIDRARRIVGIVEDTRPLTKGPYKVEKPSMYVLEINAGLCRKYGIAAGDTVDFEKIQG